MRTLKAILAGLVCVFITPNCPAVEKDISEYTFEDLLDAIAKIESNNNPDAIGDGGRAVGAFQIHEIYVNDVNRISDYPFYCYDDRYDYAKSREMVRIYLLHYGQNRSLFEMAQIHNGGPKGYAKKSTIAYAEKVYGIMAKAK
jgi:hypothetical protein